MDDYVELRAASAYSFLSAASQPEDLVERACAVGMKACAIADLYGVYGVPRFVKSARSAGIKPIIGALVEVDFHNFSQENLPRIVLLCKDIIGWQNLCEILTEAHKGYEKGKCVVKTEDLKRLSHGLVALAGGLDGPISIAMKRYGKEGVEKIVLELLEIFGHERLYLDLQRHGIPQEEYLNRILIGISETYHIGLIATNDVKYHIKEEGKIYDVLVCIGNHSTLDNIGRILPPNHERYLKSPKDMKRIFSDMPYVLDNTIKLAEQLTFDLSSTGYCFPKFKVPEGETEFNFLAHLVHEGAKSRYKKLDSRVISQINHELEIIERLGLAGYFLVTWDIARFCKENKILAQGRGSAANSVVCYALGITAIDPIRYDLLFERFLSEERGEWPDIDLDLPSGNDREKVIQYVYQNYGERHVGMASAVITFQGKGSVRDVGKVFGLDPKRLDILAKNICNYEFPEPEDIRATAKEVGFDITDIRVNAFVDIWEKIRNLPRHLSQHNGGMVISGTRLDRVVPLEPARMAGRVVIQWDKDDLADLRIIKIDLLGLGMLSAIKDCIETVKKQEGIEIDLAHLPPDDPKVFDLLCKADTVGVFQVESSAQRATLPRMKPKQFYDLVIEVAIIRPGPIVGKMVNPYLKRRLNMAPVTYAHPCLEPILKRTLGVPLFQEQIMRMAMVAAGFSGGQADELRRAMGSRRSTERMKKMVKMLREGMNKNRIPEKAQEEIIDAISSFALYGFPESHAASFALIAYASAYLKVHHPTAFYTALLNNWPMGFYHPDTLVKDAQRHGIEVRGVDVMVSEWDCTVEEKHAIRLGLRYVKGLSKKTGNRIISARKHGLFQGVRDFVERTGANQREVFLLAEAGAFMGFTKQRRDAMWQALLGGDGLLKGGITEDREDNIPSPDALEQIALDYNSIGLTLGKHPMAFIRDRLKDVYPLDAMSHMPNNKIVRVAGMVIVRQRPGTAKGMCFITLEDETGIGNVAVTKEVFSAYKAVISQSRFLLIEGKVQNLRWGDGVVSVLANDIREIKIDELMKPSAQV